MLRLVVSAILLLALASPGSAQAPEGPPEAPASLWRQSSDRITFRTARIGVPKNAGIVRFTRTFEFSHPGEGLDTGLQFESADRQVFATLYVYFPALSHVGVTALATDWVIHGQSPNLRPLGMRVVAAGGHDGGAIRGDYAIFETGLRPAPPSSMPAHGS